MLGHIVILFLILEEQPSIFHSSLYHFPPPPTVHKGSNSSTYSPIFWVEFCVGFFGSHPNECETVILIYTSLLISNVER